MLAYSYANLIQKVVLQGRYSERLFLGSQKATVSCKKNGKAIPLQAWTCPEGSRRLRLPDFKTIDS